MIGKYLILMVVLSAGFFLYTSNVRGTIAAPADIPKPWPPVMGQEYPHLELKDYKGNLVKLADLKGKVIIIEPVGMNCPACNAFAGANRKGKFSGISPQADLRSFEEYFPLYSGGISLHDSRIIFVQLLLYDLRM